MVKSWSKQTATGKLYFSLNLRSPSLKYKKLSSNYLLYEWLKLFNNYVNTVGWNLIYKKECQCLYTSPCAGVCVIVPKPNLENLIKPYKNFYTDKQGTMDGDDKDMSYND